MSQTQPPVAVRALAVIVGVALVVTALAPLFWAAAHVTA